MKNFPVSACFANFGSKTSTGILVKFLHKMFQNIDKLLVRSSEDVAVRNSSARVFKMFTINFKPTLYMHNVRCRFHFNEMHVLKPKQDIQVVATVDFLSE